MNKKKYWQRFLAKVSIVAWSALSAFVSGIGIYVILCMYAPGPLNLPIASLTVLVTLPLWIAAYSFMEYLLSD